MEKLRLNCGDTIHNATRTTANAYEHLQISGDHFAIIAIGGELHS